MNDVDNCPNWYNPSQALPWWPVPPGDPDCDGWTTTKEQAVGTNPTQACGPAAWPPDLDDNQLINVLDLLAIVPRLGETSNSSGFSYRHDLRPDALINVMDILDVAPFLSGTC